MRPKGRLIALVLVVMVSIVGGMAYWIVLSPNTPDYADARTVKIPSGASFGATVDSLSANGILHSATSFRWLATITGWRHQIKAGHYSIASGATNYDMLNMLRRGLQTPVRLTIPPGSRPVVVAQVVAREMAFTPDDFLSALRDTALVHELGTDTTQIFGFMLPETYFFYWLADAPTVVKKVKYQFDLFYDKTRAEAPDPPDLTADEVARLAGIVEWESGFAPEKPRIAGVYLNRLRHHWPLQADPTVQYAIMQREGKKRRLLFADYKIDHPYNTYNYQGLPPGPITNPSTSSIRAVLNAEHHNFYYFVAKGDGTHIFSKTMSEHRRAAQEYYRLMRQRRREQQSQ